MMKQSCGSTRPQKQRNLVAKHNYHRSQAFRDRTAYQRHSKHRNREWA